MTDSPRAALTFEQAIAYFSTLREFSPRVGRDRLLALLSLLGDPQRQLRCLHVAGTNGKGSTVTFLASVLKEAGYSVGAYFSPYVFDVRERWQIDGAMIPPGELVRLVSEIRPHIDALAQTEHGQITEFELKTAIAFRWFAERRVDFAVIEVGIGGRLDSTNVIPPPLVSLITSIGLDHVHLLGDTPGKIASEKAGIIKRGSLVCVTAVPPGEALDAISAKAELEGVPLQTIGIAEADEMSALRLSLRGDFQHYNAAAAAAALRALRAAGVVEFSDMALRTGLERAELPGRFQVLRLADGTGAATLVLDVAHNAPAAHTLAHALVESMGVDRRYTFVVGMSSSHEPGPFLAEIAPLAKRIVATSPSFRAKPAAEIARAAEALGLLVTIVEPAREAIRQAVSAAQSARGTETVVVTGSFYTVGESPWGRQEPAGL